VTFDFWSLSYFTQHDVWLSEWKTKNSTSSSFRLLPGSSINLIACANITYSDMFTVFTYKTANSCPSYAHVPLPALLSNCSIYHLT
jgi:hypothetical protein